MQLTDLIAGLNDGQVEHSVSTARARGGTSRNAKSESVFAIEITRVNILNSDYMSRYPQIRLQRVGIRS